MTLAHVVEADGFLFCRYLAGADTDIVNISE
jgi:hypothetical protein